MTTASTASCGRTARPRLVCTTIPVALMTRRSDGETAASSRRADPRHEVGRREVRRPGGGGLAGRSAREDVGAQTLDDRAHGVGHERARVALEQLLGGRLAQDLVDGRQRAQPRLAASALGAGLRTTLLAGPAVRHQPFFLSARRARMRSPAMIIANATTPKPNHQSVPIQPDRVQPLVAGAVDVDQAQGA